MQRFHTVILLLILLFSFFTRMWRVDYPTRYVFDEVYHAVTAKLIAQNDPRAFEWWNPAPEPDTAVDWLHPPLAKYTQAFFITLFGENSFGWRLSSVLFGVGVVWLTYELAYVLFKKRSLALLASFLASLDGLLLVQSRIAMNDIHVTFFILLTFLLYWKAKTQTKLLIPSSQLFLIGISAGLALASKWSGFFALALVGMYELYFCIKHLWKQPYLRSLTTLGSRIVALGCIPLLIYVSSYWLMFAQGKSLFCTQAYAVQGSCYQEKLKLGEYVWYEGLVSHFIELHHQIWWYQTHLEATHPYQSRPMQWVANTRPVWYFVNYTGQHSIENIYAFGNPLIFWFGALCVITLSSLLLLTKVKKFEKKFVVIKKNALFFTLASYFIVWLPWQLSPRIMFFYHYTPAIPVLCILIAFVLTHMSNLEYTGNKIRVPFGKVFMTAYVASAFFFFILWYPHWTALSVSKEWAENMYFLLPTWK